MVCLVKEWCENNCGMPAKKKPITYTISDFWNNLWKIVATRVPICDASRRHYICASRLLIVDSCWEELLPTGDLAGADFISTDPVKYLSPVTCCICLPEIFNTGKQFRCIWDLKKQYHMSRYCVKGTIFKYCEVNISCERNWFALYSHPKFYKKINSKYEVSFSQNSMLYFYISVIFYKLYFTLDRGSNKIYTTFWYWRRPRHTQPVVMFRI